MSKYYQLPQDDGPYNYPIDKYTSRGFSFTTRMLNFLSKIKVGTHWKRENQFTLFKYAQRRALIKFRGEKKPWQQPSS